MKLVSVHLKINPLSILWSVFNLKILSNYKVRLKSIKKPSFKFLLFIWLKKIITASFFLFEAIKTGNDSQCSSIIFTKLSNPFLNERIGIERFAWSHLMPKIASKLANFSWIKKSMIWDRRIDSKLTMAKWRCINNCINFQIYADSLLVSTNKNHGKPRSSTLPKFDSNPYCMLR